MNLLHAILLGAAAAALLLYAVDRRRPRLAAGYARLAALVLLAAAFLAPFAWIACAAFKDRRALLGSFGLPSKAADQLPGTLSGGERAKLGLAMLSAGEANLLLLDEPTNNLDPSSIAAVGAMLGDWPGTIVAVSHERGFVEALRPTFCLRLPEERYTHWREEYLDDVEMR